MHTSTNITSQQYKIWCTIGLLEHIFVYRQVEKKKLRNTDVVNSKVS